ncbi:MAG: aldehyde ferredoxin oxidoreductase family protein [bacterium]
MQGGNMGQYLDVDLTTGTVEKKQQRREDLELYVGGRGMGIRMLYDNTDPGLDPFDEKMVLIFSVGPLTGTNAPQSNRFVVTTKSPLTGCVADSHCGGNFATKLKKAGYDAVLIRGRSPKPVYLEINEDEITLRDASALWGKTTGETQEALPRTFGKAVIGPAGENRVRFAAIVSQHRVAGRCGTGAVMGAKNLKAVIADGKKKIPIAQAEEYKKLQKELSQLLKEHPMTGGTLPDLGTANLVMTCAGRNIIPTRNFQAGQDLNSVKLSGEKMRDELLVRKDGCLACPIRCGRHVKVKGRETKGPEYETIGMLGNNLGVFDLEEVTELGMLCDELGLDTISMGTTLGFATELTERGMLQSELAWGAVDTYRRAIEDTAHQRGLGKDLAGGSRRMAERYGGVEFAINVKGLELPAYDPRGCVGQGLEYAVNNRGGCHIRGSTMYLEATGPASVDPLSTKSKPELVIFQQNTNASVSALSMCYFSTQAVIPAALHHMDPNSFPYRAIMKVLLHSGPALRAMFKLKLPGQMLWFEKLLSLATGRVVTTSELAEIGARIYTLERLYNLREGVSPSEDKLPRRLLSEPLSRHGQYGVPLARMLPTYYKLRGWDPRGVPTEETVQKLRIRR